MFAAGRQVAVISLTWLRAAVERAKGCAAAVDGLPVN
jgi:hypothetical protein